MEMRIADTTKSALIDQVVELTTENRKLRESITTLNMIIQNMPRANRDSMILGSWIWKNKSSVYCDRCGYVTKHIDKSNFCPRCGAQMN